MKSGKFLNHKGESQPKTYTCLNPFEVREVSKLNLSIDYTSAPNSFSQVEWVDCGYYQSFNPGGETTQTFQNRCLQLAITGSPNNFTNSNFGNKWSDVGLSDYAQLNVSPVYSNGHVSRLNSSTSVITRKMILTLENNQWLTV